MVGFKNYEPLKYMTTLITGTTALPIDDTTSGITSSAMALGELGWPSFELELALTTGGTTDDLRLTLHTSIDGGTTYSLLLEAWSIIDIAGTENINKVLQYENVAGTHIKLTAEATGSTDDWEGTIKARRYRFSEMQAAPATG